MAEIPEIPDELRMVADDLILVDGFKVELGAGAKIGEVTGTSEPSFFITLEGRVNNSAECRTMHLAIKAELGYKLGDEIMSRLEEFVKLMKQSDQARRTP